MSERGKELDAQAKKLHDQAAHAIYLHRKRRAARQLY